MIPLADVSVIVWVGGAMLIGFVGFFVMILAFITRLIRYVFRSISGPAQRGPVDRQVPRGAARQVPRGAARPVAPRQGRPVICPHPRCGHANPRGGVYCSRCGRPLSRSSELDAYG